MYFRILPRHCHPSPARDGWLLSKFRLQLLANQGLLCGVRLRRPCVLPTPRSEFSHAKAKLQSTPLPPLKKQSQKPDDQLLGPCALMSPGERFLPRSRSVSPATEHVSTLTATALNFPASASPSSASSWPTSTCRTWLKHYSAAATRRLCRSTCGRPIASLCAARAVHCCCALLCALGSGHAPRSARFQPAGADAARAGS